MQHIALYECRINLSTKLQGDFSAVRKGTKDMSLKQPLMYILWLSLQHLCPDPHPGCLPYSRIQLPGTNFALKPSPVSIRVLNLLCDNGTRQGLYRNDLLGLQTLPLFYWTSCAPTKVPLHTLCALYRITTSPLPHTN